MPLPFRHKVTLKKMQDIRCVRLLGQKPARALSKEVGSVGPSLARDSKLVQQTE
jgi:hypothetical protein